MPGVRASRRGSGETNTEQATPTCPAGSARLARAGRALSRRLLGTACCQPGFATCPGPRQRLGLGLFLELDAFTDVTFSTLSRQLHLTLAFCEAALLLIGVLVMAVDAADTLDEMPGGLVFGAQRLATGAAEIGRASCRERVERSG